MRISLVLEVAISMVFLYLLGSQTVLSIYELAAGYRNVRGKFLYWRLVAVLGEGTAQALYGVPEIAKLTPEGQKPPNAATVGSWRWWWGKDGVPAYVPADLFAAALLRLVDPATTATDAGTLLQALANNPAFQHPASAANGPPAPAPQPNDAAQLLNSLLRTLVPTASLADCQKALAVWYDAFGERLTGWYKRRVRGWLFLIGLLLAFFANIDSPHILRYLWLHPQVSQLLAETASKRTAGQRPDSLAFTPPVAAAPAPAGPPIPRASRKSCGPSSTLPMGIKPGCFGSVSRWGAPLMCPSIARRYPRPFTSTSLPKPCAWAEPPIALRRTTCATPATVAPTFCSVAFRLIR